MWIYKYKNYLIVLFSSISYFFDFGVLFLKIQNIYNEYLNDREKKIAEKQEQ